MREKKINRFLSVILSLFFWGSGQFFICKQRLKGAMLFAVQLLVLCAELFSSYWIEVLTGQIESFSIRLHGGFFSRGIHGLITLGEVEAGKNGDHSTILLITGIITVLILLVLLAVYIWNIADAYRNGRVKDMGCELQTSGEYFRRTYRKFFPYVILAPVLLFVVFVVIMPIIFAILTAFTNYNSTHLPPGNLVDWVGLENFKKLFEVPIWSSTFFAVLRWTIIWAAVSTVTTFFLGMFQAIILNNKHARCRQLFRGIMILPWAIPQLISLLVFKNFLNGQFGPLSKFLVDIGLTDSRIGFLSDPSVVKFTIIIVNLWLGFPMFMIMIQGILSNIDKSLYEAAQIDGGGALNIFRHITLPLVLRATAPLIVMNLASNFNNFGIIYFLTEGGPVNTSYQFAGDTDILISWIYKLTLNQQLFNMAAVMNIMIFVFVAVVSVWNFRHTRAFKELA